jgi:acetylornithine deacetylase/succinyl-diaminopimelate desuccinylase-like protein
VSAPLAAGALAEWESGVDWPAVCDEALEWLRSYVRIPTVNEPDGIPGAPPGRAAGETVAARWLGGLLAREGVACELLGPPGRSSLLARVGPPGPAPTVTLLSHSDVVPAVRADWDVDPFAAEIRDGYLYGRGVLDLKGLGIAQLAALLLLHRQGVPLRRGVVLVVAADEENGGDHGARLLLRERPELLDTALLLGEGGYSPTGVLPGNVPLHAIAVAEKGYLELELTAGGTPHHASMPQPGDAPAQLVAAVARVLAAPAPVRVTPAVAALCGCLAESARGLHRTLLRHPRLLERLGSRALPANPVVRAMFSETCAVTVLAAGYRGNVVPGRARAVLSLRVLPGSDLGSATERVRRLVADPGITVTRVAHKNPTSSPFATPDFELLSWCCTDGGRARATPILSPGASDARLWRAVGVPSYGWVPFVLPVSDLPGVHGANERVGVESFTAGVRRYCRAVAALAMSGGGQAAGGVLR